MGEPIRYWLDLDIDGMEVVAYEDYLALRAECEGLRADAERYRIVREQGMSLTFSGDGLKPVQGSLSGKYLDDAMDQIRAAIDAGRGESQ